MSLISAQTHGCWWSSDALLICVFTFPALLLFLLRCPSTEHSEEKEMHPTRTSKWEHFIKINMNQCQIISYNSGEWHRGPVFTCTCGVTRIDKHNLINFTGTTFFSWSLFVSVSFSFSFYLPSPSSLHLSGARPELGGRKKQKEKKREGERGRSDFHSTLDHWSGV